MKINTLTTIVTGAMLFAASSLFAADSGNIILQGEVAAVNEITVTPQSGYNALDLTAGESDTFVALVNEKNNDPDGYTVTLVSLNASGAQARLKGDGSANTTYISYSMKYGTSGAEAAVTLDAGSATVSSTTAPTDASGVDKRLLVTIAANAWPDAGIYNDTLTVTIASK